MSKDPRKVITTNQELHIQVAQLEKVFADTGGVFSRGPELVEVTRQNGIAPLHPDRLKVLASKVVKWRTKSADENSGGGRKVKPPDDVIRGLRKQSAWNLREIKKFSRIPCILADGTIISKPGFHQEQGIFCLPRMDFPAVPENPSKDDALVAGEEILDPLSDFPFVTDSDKSAALSAVLTIAGRTAIDGSVPAFDIEAPQSRTGKTLLARAIASEATGREFPVETAPKDEAEWDKRIIDTAITGREVNILDNLVGTVNSANLAAAITATSYRSRLIYSPTSREAPLYTTWLFTGNNVRFGTDIINRTIRISIDAGVEDPELRGGQFKYPMLLATLRTRWTRTVMAALTILRAYILAGRPSHGKTLLPGFEEWDSLIRGAVIWLGYADPRATQAAFRGQADVEREQSSILMISGAVAFPDGAAFIAADLFAVAQKDPTLLTALAGLRGVAPEKLNSLDVATVLRGFRDRRAAGKRIVQREGKHRSGAVRWAIVEG